MLVVDDNETSRKFLRNEILAWRMRSGLAHNSVQALEMLRQAAAEQAPYAVAILDLQMPAMDGLTLARQIRAIPELSATKLVLLTPYGKSIPRKDLKSAGITASCSKPFRQSSLFDCLARVLSPAADTTEAEVPEPFIRIDTAATTRKERVLLAEDNAVNQRVAIGNLRKLGFEADLALNGLEVLDALEEKRYDIILMDCQMPELDGYQATREIRQREKKGHRTWIIAMTANVMVGDREKCLAAGMDDYVSKPLRREDLRAAMERCLIRLARPQYEDSSINLQHDNADELTELIDLFEASAPKSITDMKRALDQNSARDMAFAAHTLKGSCGNLGNFPLHEACVRIELAARDGHMEDMPGMVADAENKLTEMIAVLKSRPHA